MGPYNPDDPDFEWPEGQTQSEDRGDDLVEKYYQMVPYNPDDPDFEWPKGQTQSEDSGDDHVEKYYQMVPYNPDDSDFEWPKGQTQSEDSGDDHVEKYYQMVPDNPDDPDFGWPKGQTQSEDSGDDHVEKYYQMVPYNPDDSDFEWPKGQTQSEDSGDDLVEKYYQMVPYNPDDSNFEWPKGQTHSEDSGYEHVSTCIMHVKSESIDDSAKVKMNKHDNAEKMHKQDIEYDQPLEPAAIYADLDSVEKYYQMVPYNPDDSNFEWPKGQIQSEDSGYEQVSTCVMHVKSESTNDSANVKMNKHGNAEKMGKQDIGYDQSLEPAENHADLDFIEKYYQMVPYNPDDSDFEWCKGLTQSENSEDEQLLPCITHMNREDTARLDKVKMDKHGNVEKMQKQDIQYDQPSEPAANCADLDIVEKYYIMVPYNPDDSDFEWHSRQTQSEESEQEQMPKFSKKPTDLNIEEKNYKMVPYNTDDSNLEWHARQTRSEGGEYEETPKHAKETSDLIIEEKNYKRAPYNTVDSNFECHARQTQRECGKYEETPKCAENTIDLDIKEKYYKEKKYFKTFKVCKKLVFETNETNSSSSDDESIQVQTRSAGAEYEQLSKRIARGMNINKDTSDLNKVNVKKCSNAKKMHKLRKHKKNREDNKERKYFKTSKKLNFGTTDGSSSDNNSCQTLVFYSNTSDTSSDNLNKDAELETFDPMSTTLNNLGQRRDFITNARLVGFTPPAYVAMPRYNYHQLLGDSQLLRFSEQFLEGKRCVTFTEDDCRRINYVVSGQKIEDLRQRLLRDECPLSDQVIMLIGTTDFVCGTKLEDMYESFDAVLEILTQNSLRKIVLLNVPPVPKIEHKVGYWNKFKSFNHFIRKHNKEGTIVALDIVSPLTDMDGKSKAEYFDMTDLVHLNEDGLKLVKALLDILYFDKI